MVRVSLLCVCYIVGDVREFAVVGQRVSMVRDCPDELTLTGEVFDCSTSRLVEKWERVWRLL